MKKSSSRTSYVKLHLFLILFLSILSLIISCGGGGGGGGGGTSADTTPPADVTALTASPEDGKVTLSWAGSTSGDVAGYKVYRSTGGGASTPVASSLSPSTMSYACTGLTNGTAYTFKVTAYDTAPNESAGATISAYANPPLSNTDIVTASGLADGGIARQSTQTMTGTVPNPGGSSATTYQGKAYLVVNGSKISLPVTSSTPSPELVGRRFYKEGKEYLLDPVEAMKAKGIFPETARAATLAWIFSITFSINAGANTLSVEVYDLNGAFFARTSTIRVVGVIPPSSLVVTLWWNPNSTDIDLHVSPDDGVTHCYYSHPSAGEMVLDYDDTDGYGPEHVTVDQVSGTKRFKIKVYYYADHTPNAQTTTPTTANITALVGGVTKLSASRTLSAASTSASWGSGTHIWDAGEVEVTGAVRYTVALLDPDLTNYPQIKLTVTVTDPANTQNPKVTGLTPDNFFIINAGKVNPPVAVAAADNVYTLTYNDIVAGKRDLYVYVSVSAQGNQPLKGGLSSTKTYGTNYALLVGLNEYPPVDIKGPANWFDDPAQPAKFFIRAMTNRNDNTATNPQVLVVANDFSVTLTDSTAPVTAPWTGSPSAIAYEGWDATAQKYKYLLTFDRPANYLNYNGISSLTFKKEDWLYWCLKDIADVKAALLAKGSGSTNTVWETANIDTTLSNAGATKDAILNKIQAIAGNMKKYDLFYFHFSGHGSGMPAAGNNAQYLCAHADGAWISVNDLKAKLDLIPNPGLGIANIILSLDACHTGNFIGREIIARGSGEAPSGDLIRYLPFVPQMVETPPPNYWGSFAQFRDLTALSNAFVLAAQTGTASAIDSSTLQNGVYTHYLVEGISVSGKNLSAAAANTNHDVWISGEEAFSYLDPKVQAYVSPANNFAAGTFQRPQVQDNNADTNALLIYNW